MWISKNKWKETEKKIADLEARLQSQQEAFKYHLECHKTENKEFKEAIYGIQKLFDVDFVKHPQKS